MTNRVLIAADGEASTRFLVDALERHGLRVVRSFDLRSAVAGRSQCSCPHHGTDRCTCQYLVLLVYAPAGTPVVITAHSCDTTTELQIVEDPNKPDEPEAGRLGRAALDEVAQAAQAGLIMAGVGAG